MEAAQADAAHTVVHRAHFTLCIPHRALHNIAVVVESEPHHFTTLSPSLLFSESERSWLASTAAHRNANVSIIIIDLSLNTVPAVHSERCPAHAARRRSADSVLAEHTAWTPNLLERIEFCFAQTGRKNSQRKSKRRNLGDRKIADRLEWLRVLLPTSAR